MVCTGRRVGLFQAHARKYNNDSEHKPQPRRTEMKRLAGLAVLAVLTIGITLPAQDAPAPHPYYPLKVGSEWNYKVQGGPIKVKVAGTEKAGMFTGYKLETSAGNKVSATETVAVTPEGVKRFNVNGLNPDQPILFLPAN